MLHYRWNSNFLTNSQWQSSGLRASPKEHWVTFVSLYASLYFMPSGLVTCIHCFCQKCVGFKKCPPPQKKTSCLTLQCVGSGHPRPVCGTVHPNSSGEPEKDQTHRQRHQSSMERDLYLHLGPQPTECLGGWICILLSFFSLFLGSVRQEKTLFATVCSSEQ